MKDIVNEMNLQVPSKSANESFVRTTIAVFMSQIDPTVEELSDLKTAVSEAVTNCIVHAYNNKVGTIFVSSKIIADRKENGDILHKIIVKIRDKGCGIPDIKKAMEPLYTTSHNDERAGLGFSVMESFTDKVRVSSKVNYGTTVYLEKEIVTKKSE